MVVKMVVVDMNTAMTADTCRLVTSVCLQEAAVFADRVSQSAFLLACLSSHTEILFPLQVLTDSCLPALKRSIDSLVQYHQDTPLANQTSDQNIAHCVQFVFNEGNRLLSNTYKQVEGVIEVLFITSQIQLKSKLDAAISKHSVSTPRRVTVLTVMNSNKSGVDIPACLTEIDDVTVPHCFTSILRSLRSWFFGQESELVTLCISETLTLCCDMLPLSIDVTAMSVETQNCFTIDAATAQPRQQGKKLKVLKMFKQDQICESVLYGSTRLLIPSTHWTLEWDVLENNQWNFAAFCKHLSDPKTAILCQHSSGIGGLFLVLAETGGSAIIKPILCSELLLPKPELPLIQLPEPTIQSVGEELSKLEISNEPFSPLDHSSGLHVQLIEKMGPKKRKLRNELANSVYEGSAAQCLSNSAKPSTAPPQNSFRYNIPSFDISP